MRPVFHVLLPQVGRAKAEPGSGASIGGGLGSALQEFPHILLPVCFNSEYIQSKLPDCFQWDNDVWFRNQ